jgi:hypothetical protein
VNAHLPCFTALDQRGLNEAVTFLQFHIVKLSSALALEGVGTGQAALSEIDRLAKALHEHHTDLSAQLAYGLAKQSEHLHAETNQLGGWLNQQARSLLTVLQRLDHKIDQLEHRQDSSGNVKETSNVLKIVGYAYNYEQLCKATEVRCK